ncbi:tail fiber domain-containing protein [Dyella sp. 2RAB6]|uniref:tail fiber domain-containing protein n=1 Tax=Dyella sp. 2RAB6 TaxID=3232992 RepID=UPI003F8E9A5C
MAIQLINLGTPPKGEDGDTNRTAHNKCNDNFTNLDSRATTAQATADSANQLAGTAKSTADAAKATADRALPNASPLFTGSIGKIGVPYEYCYRVSNIGTDRGIGGSWGEWTQGRTPVIQLDAMSNVSAYMLARVTRWGARHLAAIDVYEGGSATSTPQLHFHVGGSQNAFQFLEGGNAIFAGTLTQNSDYRIKKDVVGIDPAVAASNLRSVRPVEYSDNREAQDASRRAGMIAHELAQSFPLLVEGNKDAVRRSVRLKGDTTPYMPGTEPAGYKPPTQVAYEEPALQNVNYVGLVPYVIAAWKHTDDLLQEAMARIAALEQRP